MKLVIIILIIYLILNKNIIEKLDCVSSIQDIDKYTEIPNKTCGAESLTYPEHSRRTSIVWSCESNNELSSFTHCHNDPECKGIAEYKNHYSGEPFGNNNESRFFKIKGNCDKQPTYTRTNASYWEKNNNTHVSHSH